MNEKSEATLKAAVEPLLGDLEGVEVVSVATIGELSTKKVAAWTLVTAVLTLGMVTMVRKPRKMFIILTSQRLLVVNPAAVRGRTITKVAMQLPRSRFTVTKQRNRRVLFVVPTLVVELAVEGVPAGVKLQFPTVCRAEGERFVAAVGPTPVPGVTAA